MSSTNSINRDGPRNGDQELEEEAIASPPGNNQAVEPQLLPDFKDQVQSFDTRPRQQASSPPPQEYDPEALSFKDQSRSVDRAGPNAPRSARNKESTSANQQDSDTPMIHAVEVHENRFADDRNENENSSMKKLRLKVVAVIVIVAIVVGGVVGAVVAQRGDSDSKNSEDPTPSSATVSTEMPFPTMAPSSQKPKKAFQDTDELRRAVDVYLLADKALTLEYGKNIGQWDVSRIRDFSRLFDAERNNTVFSTRGSASFSINEDLSQWNTSSAESMFGMFARADQFNSDISGWDVSGVTTAAYMFFRASLFNQDISEWTVTSLRDVQSMFWSAAAFNQSLHDWDVGAFENMSDMFRSATAFDGDISSWVVRSTKRMNGMFWEASSFNCNLSNWNMSSVEAIDGMFFRARRFNQDLGAWDVGGIVDMTSLFQSADSFNQDISTWNVGSVQEMDYMFERAMSFNQDVSKWNVRSVRTMNHMFSGAVSFNQDLCPWKMQLSNVTLTYNMFGGVINLSEKSVECPVTNDPVLPDGPLCHLCK